MKWMIIVCLLLPATVWAQKWEYEGEYTLLETAPKKRLKAWDTINEVYTFTADSFKYAFAVMRPTATNKIVSVDYAEYGIWQRRPDTLVVTTDSLGQEYPFVRIYATLGVGKVAGYFEPTYISLMDFAPTGNRQPAFRRNNKIFTRTSGKVVRPLMR